MQKKNTNKSIKTQVLELLLQCSREEYNNVLEAILRFSQVYINKGANKGIAQRIKKDDKPTEQESQPTNRKRPCRVPSPLDEQIEEMTRAMRKIHLWKAQSEVDLRCKQSPQNFRKKMCDFVKKTQLAQHAPFLHPPNERKMDNLRRTNVGSFTLPVAANSGSIFTPLKIQPHASNPQRWQKASQFAGSSVGAQNNIDTSTTIIPEEPSLIEYSQRNSFGFINRTASQPFLNAPNDKYPKSQRQQEIRKRKAQGMDEKYEH